MTTRLKPKSWESSQRAIQLANKVGPEKPKLKGIKRLIKAITDFIGRLFR